MKNPALIVLSVLTLGLLGHSHRQSPAVQTIKHADQQAKKRIRKLKDAARKRNRKRAA